MSEIKQDAATRMKGARQALEEDLSGIRTGRAHPALIEKLPVEYYGLPTPLIQLASISVPEARALLIRPFDISTLKAIERSIQASDLGLTPNNDGKSIRLNLPPLTEERRRDLVKMVHTRVEEGRVAVRNVRRDAMKDMRDFEQEKLISEDDLERGEDELQKLTEKYISELNAIGEHKENEILEF
ncbi:MAG: ribosome recycling factor [Chloroflexi bacterium RBG_16_54_18]|nr:MAG: ribosome recycling factor [Chloroflexi bacterium RBG_16_54_18]